MHMHLKVNISLLQHIVNSKRDTVNVLITTETILSLGANSHSANNPFFNLFYLQSVYFIGDCYR